MRVAHCRPTRRDIKPGNLLLRLGPDESVEEVWAADFGLSLRLPEGSDKAMARWAAHAQGAWGCGFGMQPICAGRHNSCAIVTNHDRQQRVPTSTQRQALWAATPLIHGPRTRLTSAEHHLGACPPRLCCVQGRDVAVLRAGGVWARAAWHAPSAAAGGLSIRRLLGRAHAAGGVWGIRWARARNCGGEG